MHYDLLREINMKIGEIIYEESQSGQIINSKLEDYILVEGIWALYGKRNGTLKYECLNVGKSKNVGREILYDISCMHFLKIRVDGTRKYINQFKEDCKFMYKAGQPQEYLYPIIASRYSSFKFVYVYDKSDRNEEKKYAQENKPVFWRNGKPYK